MSAEGIVDRLRQPAYTGENRCAPCTVVNVTLAVGLAALLGVVVPAAGVAALVLSLSAVYLRGYLVPGTPELTKRYLPDRVHRWFGKAPDLPDAGEAVDVEAYLLDAGVLRETAAGDELEPTAAFTAAWDERIDEVRGSPASAAGELLGLDEPGVEERDGATVVTDEGVHVADWPSNAALLADLGAVAPLRARDSAWPTRNRGERGRILAGLRLFVETCPTCGGTPELGEDTVESCCRRAQVYTHQCRDCGARLLEIEQ